MTYIVSGGALNSTHSLTLQTLRNSLTMRGTPANIMWYMYNDCATSANISRHQTIIFTK